jgi:hypothetical protein
VGFVGVGLGWAGLVWSGLAGYGEVKKRMGFVSLS